MSPKVKECSVCGNTDRVTDNSERFKEDEFNYVALCHGCKESKGDMELHTWLLQVNANDPELWRQVDNYQQVVKLKESKRYN